MSHWEWTPTDMSDVPSLAKGGGTMPPTLTEFIAARLEDLEAMARAVMDEQRSTTGDQPIDTGDDPWRSERAFAEYLTPARVLADVAAKKAIVEECCDVLGEPELGPQWRILRHLALPYADHEDFDESWRP